MPKAKSLIRLLYSGPEAVKMIERRLRLVTVGGTFDALHKGHWFLLEEAFKVAEKVLIGLTTDEFAEALQAPLRRPIRGAPLRHREVP